MPTIPRWTNLTSARYWSNRDFSRFWLGETISSVGDAISMFALPLLVFKLTGSALNLALTAAISMLPYLGFGLIVGAWVDRVNRKRLMIATDVARALVISLIPLLGWLGVLSVSWIYVCGFISATLNLCFEAAHFAAIPSLVEQDELVKANSQLQASYSVATIVGPLLAGALLAFLPLQALLLLDAASFGASAFTLSIIRTSFNGTSGPAKPRTSLRQDIGEGLRYIIGHPILRNIALMMAMVNLVATSVGAQLVFYAKDRLHADDAQIGWIYAAGSVGLVILSTSAAPLRKRFGFGQVALGALTFNGIVIILLGLNSFYWLALPLWACSTGSVLLFNVNTGSLRQAITPNHMLGRVMTSARVLAWSVIPIGTSLTGLIVEKTGRIDLVYLGIGVIVIVIPTLFRFTALGHADDFLPKKDKPLNPEPATAPKSETVNSQR